MLSFRKKSKTGAEVHLSPNVESTCNAKHPNVWLSNEDICGCAVFSLPVGVAFSHSKVALRGTVIVKTDQNAGASSLQRSWRTEKLLFLGASLNSTARADFKTTDGLIKIPFTFKLADVFKDTQSTIIHTLPPSVDSKSEPSGKWVGLRNNELEAQYTITYSISASVYSKKGLEASTTKNVPVLPVSHGQPSESPSDSPGEYFFAASTPSPSKFSSTKVPPFTLEVAAQEPEAILLDRHESLANGSTTIPFIIKALPQLKRKIDVKTLPKQCQIRARLVSRTLVTPDRIEEIFVPYVDQSRFAKTSFVQVHKSDEQEFSLSLEPWNHIASDSAEEFEEFALSKCSVDFRVPHNKVLPTFFTPLLTRRYSIEIAIGFPKSLVPGLKLSLPIQIVYDADD